MALEMYRARRVATATCGVGKQRKCGRSVFRSLPQPNLYEVESRNTDNVVLATVAWD